MKTRKFEVNLSNGETYDIYTVNGMPNECVYFYDNETSPSSNEQSMLDNAIEEGDYEEVDFDLDEIRETAFYIAVKDAIEDNFGCNAKYIADEACVTTIAEGTYQVVSEHDSYFDEEDNPGHSDHINFDGSPMRHFDIDNETFYFVKQ